MTTNSRNIIMPFHVEAGWLPKTIVRQASFVWYLQANCFISLFFKTATIIIKFFRFLLSRMGSNLRFCCCPTIFSASYTVLRNAADLFKRDRCPTSVPDIIPPLSSGVINSHLLMNIYLAMREVNNVFIILHVYLSRHGIFKSTLMIFLITLQA